MVLADQKTCPPSLCEFITLITYQFSPVTLRLSCWPLASLPLTYPSRHRFIEGCWLINIRDSVFLFHSTVARRTNHFNLVCSNCFHQSPKFFYSPPPGSCHPLFTLLYPFHLPDFLQPACFLLLCLFALCVVASVAPVRCAVLGELDWPCCDVVLPYYTRSAPYLETGNQARERSLWSPRKARKPREILFFSPLTPSLSLLWSRP